MKLKAVKRQIGPIVKISEMDFDRTFTVIVGKNGIGKTALLSSIHNTIMETSKSLEIENPPNFSVIKLPNSIGSTGPVSLASDPWTDTIKAEITRADRGQSQYKRAELISLRKKILEHTKKSSLELITSKEKISDLVEGLEFLQKGDVETQTVQKIFVDHFQAIVRNVLTSKKIDFETALEQAAPHPWDDVNKVLGELDIGYKVTNPVGLTHIDEFTLNLLKNDGSEISFDALSSGEKTVISISILAYLAKKSGVKPGLIILDEPDAHLHPYLISTLMSIIKNVLLGQGCKVILSTHNPITASLAPEESLYELITDESGFHKIEKVSVEFACKKLLAPLNKIALTRGDQLVVMTEGSFDRDVYEFLFSKIDPRIIRNDLLFVPTQIGTTSGSSSTVIGLLEYLRKNSDKHVGIIDYDGANIEDSSKGIYVIDGRYSLENFLYDPLMIAALVLDLNSKFFDRFINDVRIDYPNELYSMSPLTLQKISDQVSTLVFAKEDRDKYVSSKRIIGCDIFVPAALTSIKGHELSKLFAHASAENKLPLNKYISGNDLDNRKCFSVIQKVWKLLPINQLELLKRIAGLNV